MRFHGGLVAGMVISGVAVSLLIYTVGGVLHAALSEQLRMLALSVIGAGLALADVTGRTPHVWRQVPQSLIGRLAPGPRGLVWGLDLGLLATTQKVASLIWMAVVGVTLVQPSAAPWLLISMALLSCLAVAALSITPGALSDRFNFRDPQWLRRIRIVSGCVILLMSMSFALQAVR